jgi:hypothetical protein
LNVDVQVAYRKPVYAVEGVNHKPDRLSCGHLNDGRLEREFCRHHLHFMHGIRA